VPIGPGVIGIVISILFLFIAFILYDAITTNVVDCSAGAGGIGPNLSAACKSALTYANIAFVIAPIGILLDVFGILPIFGGRFAMR